MIRIDNKITNADYCILPRIAYKALLEKLLVLFNGLVYCKDTQDEAHILPAFHNKETRGDDS